MGLMETVPFPDAEDFDTAQLEQRRPWIFRDEFDRRWLATIDIKTGLPVGPGPSPQFKAPIYPPNHFFRYNPRRLERLHTNPQAWYDERVQAHQRYRDKLLKVATMLYKDEAIRYAENPTPQLLRLVGDPPAPIEQIEAYIDENPWVLGFGYVEGEPPPELLRPFFPMKKTKATGRFSKAAMLAAEGVRPLVVEPPADNGPENPATSLAQRAAAIIGRA